MQSRLFLIPTQEVNEIIGSVTARALKLYNVELFAWVWLGNHFHLLLRAEPDQISRFLAHIQSRIAHKVGALIGWQGKFWHRRFSAEPVLDDDALLGRLKYIVQHGEKEGLTDSTRGEMWPGFTSIPELLDGEVALV